MLGVKTYPNAYIDTCRAEIAARLASFDRLADAASSSAAAALADFAPRFNSTLVVYLEACFVHRVRALEGKDGNPLNEIRMLASSIIEHAGVLTANSTIRYRPQDAVLGIGLGDTIDIDRDGLLRLVDAFFAELRQRFADSAVS
jgi:hypothetical protein